MKRRRPPWRNVPSLPLRDVAHFFRPPAFSVLILAPLPQQARRSLSALSKDEDLRAHQIIVPSVGAVKKLEYRDRSLSPISGIYGCRRTLMVSVLRLRPLVANAGQHEENCDHSSRGPRTWDRTRRLPGHFQARVAHAVLVLEFSDALARAQPFSTT